MVDDHLDGVSAIIAGVDWTRDPSREVVVVMYGYFDDSGSNEHPVGLMAGYVAHGAGWRQFENNTKRLFSKENITFFRAKLFDHGQDQFKGWTLERKRTFARTWCGYASRYLLRGISSAAVRNDLLAVNAVKNPKLPRLSLSAQCMQMALARLCADGDVWSEIERYGFHLFVESSTAANEGIRQDLNRVVGINKLDKHLRAITFVKKQDSRAVQFADYLAYYSHRFALTAMHDSLEGRTEFLDLAQDSVPTIMSLAHRFSENPEYFSAYSAWKRRSS